MEHVKFKNEMPFSDLVMIAKDIIGNSNNIEEKTGLKTLGTVVGVSDGRFAANRTLCFLDKPPKQGNIERLRESFIVTNKDIAPALGDHWLMIVDDPRALFIDLVYKVKATTGFSCFTSMVDANPNIHPEADVHPQAVIEEGVFIGAGSAIAAGCVIKRGTYIGCNVIVRENTVIGCDGIALYKANDGRVLRFPHLAGVIIEDEVEVGASCVLPRGVMTSSRIGPKTVIGNQSNVGHGVTVGRKVWISVGCLIGGNTTVGDGSTFGLGVNVRDNLRIGNNCSIGMGSVVVKDAQDGSSLFGNPAKKLHRISAGPER